MTLHQLQYFRVMAETLHYTKAAKILHISQPSLSYALSQLESELGVPLFQKVGKRIYLTSFGKAFKKSNENILSELEFIIIQLQDMKKNAQKEIRLCYIQSLSSAFIPHIIEMYYRHQDSNATAFIFAPNQQHDLTGELKNGKLDVVICAEADDALPHKKIADQELILIVPKNHPFAAMSSVCLNDLSDKPMVMLAPKTGLYKTIHEIFSANSAKLNITQEACDYNAAINYVSLGKGVSIIPHISAIEHHNVVPVRIRDLNCVRPIYMLWNDCAAPNDSKDDFIALMLQLYPVPATVLN